MTYYQDEIEKMKYLRNRIAQSLVLTGEYPDRNMVNSRLEAIDTKLALFDHRTVKPGDPFDVKRFNTEFTALYNDLLILYRLVYEFTAVKFQETKSYAEMHLAELEALAKRYSQKTELETGSTSIGTTIFFQGSGFAETTKNYVTTINFGDIKVNKGSKVAFFIKGRYFEQENVTFYLGTMKCSTYAINEDYVVVPGMPDHSTYTCTFDKGVKHNAMFALNGSAFTPTQKNNYIVYGGKNQIMTNDGKRNAVVDYDEGTPFTLNDEKGRVTMYVVGGKYINFDFSKEPVSKNFSGYAIQNLRDCQMITFEYEGPFTFSYRTDGDVYAAREHGIVKDNMLLYPDITDGIIEFRIDEYTGADSVSYKLYAKIEQINPIPPLITMVAVKELSVMDEVDIL